MVGTGGNNGENDEDNDGKIQSGIDSEDGANHRKMKTMVVRAIVWALSESSFNLNQSGASYEQRYNRIRS